MKGIFTTDSPFFNFLNKLVNLVVLNLCFVISCVPIITIGTAITSLYSVNLKMVKNEESYVFQSYFRAFKQNFKISTIAWLVTLAFGVVFYFYYNFSKTLTGGLKWVLIAAVGAIFVLYIAYTIYIFPYISRFENTYIESAKNSVIIALTNISTTLAIMLTTAAAVLLSVFNFEVFVRLIFVWAVVGFSAMNFLHSFFIKRVFNKYEDNSKEDK